MAGTCQEYYFHLCQLWSVKCDFLKMLFRQHSLAVTEAILVREHMLESWGKKQYTKKIFYRLGKSLFFYLPPPPLIFTCSKIGNFRFLFGKIVKIWFCGKNNIRGKNLKIGLCYYQCSPKAVWRAIGAASCA